MFRKLCYGFLLLFMVGACLDPYQINIEGYDNLLVVDGLLTDENKAHTIVLRKSTTNIDEDSPYESGAYIYVTDSKEEQYIFAEFGPGIYKSDSTTLKVTEGESYTLHIQTSNGKTYESSTCTILPKTTIDKIYYKKNSEWDINNEYENVGISIYVDGQGINNGYVRWLYEEDWKFRIPYPEQYIIDENNIAIPIPVINEVCWKKDASNNINVHSLGNQVSPEIKSREIVFIPPGLSDKLTIRYSILVKQLSISKEEYEYWSKLSESTEDVGDVFGRQPFSIIGNIKNVNDPNEPVLGYFQTGSVASKRLYINDSVVRIFDLPLISPTAGCYLDTFKVDGFAWYSAYQIYNEKVINGVYKLYDPILASNGFTAVGLLLTVPRCSDCSLTGSPTPPAFWEN